MSALWPLQKALAARLKAHPALMGRITGVHDGEAPQDTGMPYVVIGEPTEVPSGALGQAGFSDTITVHVFSGTRGGRKEALEIAALMDAALAAPLALEGHTASRLRPEFRTVLVENDGVRHAPVRYRILTFANA